MTGRRAVPNDTRINAPSGKPAGLAGKNSAQSVLNAARGKGATGDEGDSRPVAPNLCRRGHNKNVTGVYLHLTSANGRSYRTPRCRRCRIEDVQNCLDRASDGEPRWGDR